MLLFVKIGRKLDLNLGFIRLLTPYFAEALALFIGKQFFDVICTYLYDVEYFSDSGLCFIILNETVYRWCDYIRRFLTLGLIKADILRILLLILKSHFFGSVLNLDMA